MQSDVNGLSGRFGVVASDTQEWIKRRGRVGIQQRVAQPRLAGFANGQALPVVSGVTETHFPVPSLEIIAKFSHLTLQPDVEKGIPVGELFTSRTGVINAAKPNPRSHGSWDSVNDQSRIPDREGIKRKGNTWFGCRRSPEVVCLVTGSKLTTVEAGRVLLAPTTSYASAPKNWN